MQERGWQMILAHKIKLNPTKEQEVYFAKACGVARFTYNWGLARWNKLYDGGEKPNWMALKKELNAVKKEKFPWMFEVSKCAPEAALANLGVAWGNFFRDVKKKGSRKAGRPKFKKKGRNKDVFSLDNNNFSTNGRSVKIAKLGSVLVAEELRYSGKLMSATVSKIAGSWFITIMVEVGEDYKLPSAKSHSVGIDLGIKTAVVLSTSKVYKSPKAYAKDEKKLAKANRTLHRRVKGSSNRKKAAAKVARIHDRIANVRKDWINKVTTSIARKYQTVVTENLNVAGMVTNRCLSKSISDIGMGEIVRQLEYKTKLRTGRVEKINRFFPSSKQCRICSVKHESLTLADRTFSCPSCGHTEDRDLHAAKNIHQEGLRILRESTGGQPGSHAHGLKTSAAEPRKRFGRKSIGRSGKVSQETDVKFNKTVAQTAG